MFEKWRKSPSDVLMGEVLKDNKRLHQLWEFVAFFDIVAVHQRDRKGTVKPTFRTCCCGTLILFGVMAFFLMSVAQEYLAHAAIAVVTDGVVDPAFQAPLPALGLAVCDRCRSRVNMPIFLKYVKPRFRYRRMTRASDTNRNLSSLYMYLEHDVGPACGIPDDVLSGECTYICPRLGTAANPIETRARTKIYREMYARSNLLEDRRNHNVTVAGNLTLQGRYGNPVWSYFEAGLELRDDADLSKMSEEFWNGTEDCTADYSINVLFKFANEDWSRAAVLAEGEWSWYLYDRLPNNKSTESPYGLRYNAELTPNFADVGPLRPVHSAGSQMTTHSWTTWEAYYQRVGGTREQPYLPQAGDKALIVSRINFGQKARFVHVTYPNAVQALIDVGATYEFALVSGIAAATIVGLLCRCRLQDASTVACQWFQGELPEPPAKAPEEDQEDPVPPEGPKDQAPQDDREDREASTSHWRSGRDKEAVRQYV